MKYWNALVCVLLAWPVQADPKKDLRDIRRTQACSKLPPRAAIACETRMINAGGLSTSVLALVYMGRGIQYFRLRRYRQAIADISHMIRLQPRSNTGYILRINVYTASRRFREALTDANHLVRTKPNNFLPYLARGSVFAKAGNRAAAMRDYRKALSLKPGDKHILAALRRVKRGGLRRKARRATGSAKAQVKPKKAAAKRRKPAAKKEPAWKLALKKCGYRDPKKKPLQLASIANCTRAIKSGKLDQKKLMWAYLFRGRAHHVVGKFKEALADFDAAEKLDPKHTRAYSSRADVYAARKRYRKAIDQYDTIIRLRPEFAFAYVARAKMYEKTGDRDAAIRDYRQGLRHHPEHRIARKRLVALGVTPPIYVPKGTVLTEAALTLIRQGTAAARKAKWAEAIKRFMAAHKLAPRAPLPMFNLALAHDRQGQFLLSAAAWYRTYLAADSKAANATKICRRIETLVKRHTAYANDLARRAFRVGAEARRSWSSAEARKWAISEGLRTHMNLNEIHLHFARIARAFVFLGHPSQAAKVIRQLAWVNYRVPKADSYSYQTDRVYYGLGRAFAETGNTRLATYYFSRMRWSYRRKRPPASSVKYWYRAPASVSAARLPKVWWRSELIDSWTRIATPRYRPCPGRLDHGPVQLRARLKKAKAQSGKPIFSQYYAKSVLEYLSRAAETSASYLFCYRHRDAIWRARWQARRKPRPGNCP